MVVCLTERSTDTAHLPKLNVFRLSIDCLHNGFLGIIGCCCQKKEKKKEKAQVAFVAKQELRPECKISVISIDSPMSCSQGPGFIYSWLTHRLQRAWRHTPHCSSDRYRCAWASLAQHDSISITSGSLLISGVFYCQHWRSRCFKHTQKHHKRDWDLCQSAAR